MVSCSSCGAGTDPKGLLCPACGQRIDEEIISDEERALIARTSAGADRDDASDAIADFLERYPNSPRVDHVRLTLHMTLMSAALAKTSKQGASFREPGAEWLNVEALSLASKIDKDLPFRLVNDRPTSLRVIVEREDTVRETVVGLRKVMTDWLRDLCDASQAEAATLREQRTGPATGAEIDQRLDLLRETVQERRYEEALSDLVELKSIAPDSLEVRRLLGETYWGLERGPEGLKDLLYGAYLESGDDEITKYLVLVLTGLGLFPAARDIAVHYERYGSPKNPDVVRVVSQLERVSRVVTAMVIGQVVPPRDLDAGRRDLIDDLEIEERDWLALPSVGAILERARKAPAVFLSYRRADSAGLVGRLELALRERVPGLYVFRDFNSIAPGAKFADAIERALDRSAVFIAVIGPDWAGKRADGTRRIDEEKDWVRRELEAAVMKRGGVVVPTLVGGARMPPKLPAGLVSLSALQAYPLRQHRLDTDIGRLVIRLGELLEIRVPESESPDALDVIEKLLSEFGAILAQKDGIEIGFRNGERWWGKARLELLRVASGTEIPAEVARLDARILAGRYGESERSGVMLEVGLSVQAMKALVASPERIAQIRTEERRQIEESPGGLYIHPGINLKHFDADQGSWICEVEGADMRFSLEFTIRDDATVVGVMQRRVAGWFGDRSRRAKLTGTYRLHMHHPPKGEWAFGDAPTFVVGLELSGVLDGSDPFQLVIPTQSQPWDFERGKALGYDGTDEDGRTYTLTPV